MEKNVNKQVKQGKQAKKVKQVKQPVRLFVKTIKTLYGVKHAVVDASGVIQNHGRGVAVFDYNKEGLALAREAKAKLQVAA